LEGVLQLLEALDEKLEVENVHPLALLAEEVQTLAKNDARVFAPILSKWHPESIAISACLLHSLYRKELVRDLLHLA
jgi:hypothetical protein